MICPNCGKETVGKFCPSCGAKMPAVDETVVLNDANNPWKQAAAQAAAKAPESVRPAPERPAPNQTFSPNPSAPGQPFVPNQPAVNQGFAPNQPAPSQGFVPNQPAQNQPFVPNQPVQRQPFVPNQPASNQGFAPDPTRTYVPQQGNTVSQNAGAFQDLSPAAVGKTPASQLVRKIATSGAWVVATLATTLAFLCSLGYFIYSLVTGLVSDTESYIVSSAPGLLISGIFVLLLWVILGSAGSKRNEKMGTGPLTLMKVFFIITLILVCLLLLGVVIFGVLGLVFGSDGDFSAEVTSYINQLLREFDLQLSMNVSAASLIAVLAGFTAVVLIFAIIFVAKVLKSLTTGKRVIRTGIPDDRVSIFVAIFSILGAVFMIICGIILLFVGELSYLLLGATLLLNAIASICFAAVIFKFRSGMRQLGVRKGVMQRPA